MNPRLLIVLFNTYFCVSSAKAEVISLVSARDTTIYSSAANISNGSGEHFFAGVNLHTSTIRRGLLQFDVANAVPAGSTITSVELRLTMSMTVAGPVQIGLFRALSDWGESSSDAPGGEGGGATAAPGDATWFSNFHSTSTWSTPGGDFATGASAQCLVDQAAVVTWTSTPALVADVQSWIDSPATNFGWFLLNADEVTQPSAKRFDTRENPVASVRPRLTIVFTSPACGAVTNYCTALPNSTGAPATISAVGSTSLSSNSLTLASSGLPSGSPHLFIMGTTHGQLTFGDGLLCLAGSITRIGPIGTASAAGSASLALDFTSAPLAGSIAAGDVRMFQCWYRSNVAGGAGFNLSDGLSVRFCP